MFGTRFPVLVVPPAGSRPFLPSLARALLVPSVLCGMVVLALLAYRVSGRDPQNLLRDPAALLGVSPAIGVLSFVGVLSVGAAAAVCLIAARHAPRDGGMLGFAGALSAALAADDLLMLHEAVGPRLLGVPEAAFFAAYAVAGAGLTWTFRRQLAPRRAPILWLAFGCLALSMGVDALSGSLLPVGSRVTTAEDALKLFGWLIWASFWIERSDLAMSRSRPEAA